MPFRAATLLSAALVLSPSSPAAQEQAGRLSNLTEFSREGVIETKGLVALDVGGTRVPKRFVLRYPADSARWNGSLVIGAHGGSGGNNFDPAGIVIGTDETALDDVIGRHATASGFAYASVDRDGAIDARGGLALTNQFADIVAAEVSSRLGRAPSRRYLVGLSMGGGITRVAAEDAMKAGHVIIAGAGGDLPAHRGRRGWPPCGRRRAQPGAAATVGWRRLPTIGADGRRAPPLAYTRPMRPTPCRALNHRRELQREGLRPDHRGGGDVGRLRVEGAAGLPPARGPAVTPPALPGGRRVAHVGG
jgi:hypothetical protein